MSWKPDKNMRTIAVTAFLVVAASMLFYFFLFRTTTLGFGLSKVFSVLNPIIYGFVIAYILNPQMIVYEKIVCRILLRIVGALLRESRKRRHYRSNVHAFPDIALAAPESS